MYICLDVYIDIKKRHRDTCVVGVPSKKIRDERSGSAVGFRAFESESWITGLLP